MRTIGLALAAAMLICGVSRGQVSPAPAISRSDWAVALLRFERAYASRPPGQADRLRVNQAFDSATRLYFEARHADAIRAVNELTDSIAFGRTPPAADALIDSLQVRVAPEIAQRTRPSVLRIRVCRMYPVSTAEPVKLRLVIRAGAGAPIIDEPFEIAPEGPPATITRRQPDAPPGQYRIDLIGPDGVAHPIGRWNMVESPLDFYRVNNDRQLLSVQPTTPQMIHATVAARSRNLLISDRIDLNNAAQFLANPVELAGQVQSEIAALLSGKDPYVNRTGDWWRAILAGQMQIPARVYAPALVKDGKPLPLVIALSGAGGDENTFMYLMGAGRIRSLAEEHGFVVVAPSTPWVMRNLASLDAILESMSCIYPIDPSRVCLVGHGIGAQTAIGMAAHQPDKVARVVLFSGGDFANVGKIPATRLYYGAIDPVYAPTAKHKSVDIREIEQRGHTLIVHDLLPEAIEWLLGQ